MLFYALSWDTDFLALVPIPLGNLLVRHADSVTDLNCLLVAPDIFLVEFLEENFHLALILAHTLAGLSPRSVDLFLDLPNVLDRLWLFNLLEASLVQDRVLIFRFF